MLCLRIYSLLAIWLAGGTFWAVAQTTLPVAAAVQQFRDQGGRFQTLNIFASAPQRDAAAGAVAPNAEFLTLDPRQLSNTVEKASSALTLHLPYHGETLTLDLLETDVYTGDFSVVTSTSGNEPVSYRPGRHYRGALRGDGRSVVALSIFAGEIMGLIADDRHGDLVLGRLDRPQNDSEYILYADQDLTVQNPFSCQAVEIDPSEKPRKSADHPEVSGCVRVYFETDYELFQNKGSVQATVDYVAGAFNQLAALYANEEISVTLSQVYVWVTPDSYSISSSSTALNQFKALRKSYNGDIAHLVSIGGSNLGGIAYVDVLCAPSYAYAFSDINTSYSSVPTYSWTVEVLTHEMGHNLGSPHTQSCSWPGGAIDNCFTTEGGCAPGPEPVNGGTIMSYCHLTGYGINFNNGFGALPGDKIRNEVANATCLAASCAPAGSCQAPKTLTVSNVNGSGATVSWTAVTGATAYAITWRAVGAASWSSANNATSPYTLTGLPANDEIEVRVQSVCGSNLSDYSYGVIFITSGSSGGGTTCGAPANLSATAGSTTSASVSWTAVSGASSYQLSYKTSAATTWSAPVNIGGTSYTLSGLTAATTYDVRVAASCAGVLSGYSTTSFTTKSSGSGGTTCGTPGNLNAAASSATAASISWGSVSGALSYSLWYKTSTSSTWSAGVKVNGTSYSLGNLTASTTYNIRVQAVCSIGNSGFATTSFTTPSSGGGGTKCPMPQNFMLNYVTSTAAIISWNAASGAASYDLQIKKSTSTSWLTFIKIPATVVQITNMQPNSTYEVRVRSRCSDNAGDVSDYTPVLKINTPANVTGSDEVAALNDGETAAVRLTDENEAPYDLLVYPNPTTGRVWVHCTAPEAAHIEWFDLNGRLLHVSSGEDENGIREFDLSRQAAGIYIVRMLGREGRQAIVRRIVKE